jgi:two-component system phosphate regulon sensor histidine kinase PhoR
MSSTSLPLRAGASTAVVALLAIGAWAAVALPRTREAARERERQALSRAAEALADDVARRGSGGDLAARVAAAAGVAGMRLTVVGEADRVLVDSATTDARVFDAHGERPEVVEARRTGRARVRRFSRSLSQETEYAAARVGDTRVVARAARPASDVDEVALAAARLHPGVAAALVAFAGAAGAWLARPTQRAIEAIAASVSTVGRPDAPPPPRDVPGPLLPLARAWEETSQRLSDALDRAVAGHERLSSVLEGMAEAVLAVDREENVQFLNEPARVLLRLGDGEQGEGRPLHALLREPRVLRILRAALEAGEHGEAEVVWGEAPPRLVRFSAAPVRGGGPGAFLLARDISTLRRLERMRSDFVANVSHELRTPISAIAGAAETLAEGALSDGEAAPRFVDAIRRHADRLRALVDDLLTLSRLESAPETIERVPVDLALVARHACEAVASRAKQAGLALEVDSNGPVRVLGDPEALRRLVDNLVVNALTYTPAGGRVSVSVRLQGGRAVLVVADTGIGIAREHVDRIFERFYRVDKARSREKGGTGLGLAIVKHAVNLHEGEIRVESRVGQGSTFTVSIPRVEPAGSTRGGGQA